MAQQHIIRAFGNRPWGWYVWVDGQPDPRNRDFEDFNDVKKTYAVLKASGYYKDYEIVKAWEA